MFAGLAAADSAVICVPNVVITPTMRGEGYTEQTGDITLTCSGGVAPALGSVVPQVTITVFYNTTVTSRLLPQASASNAISEALLTIDEPGSGLAPPVPGFGPAAPQNLARPRCRLRGIRFASPRECYPRGHGHAPGNCCHDSRQECVPGDCECQLCDIQRCSHTGSGSYRLADLTRHERSPECQLAIRRSLCRRRSGTGCHLL